MKRIAILLDGSIANDGRVRRTITSLSDDFIIDLYYCDPSKDDDKLFKSENIKLIPYIIERTWFKNNFQLHNKFDDLILKAKKSAIHYDIIYSNDFPLLKTATKLKDYYHAKLIYDSHEIYIATINQFFPSKGFKGLIYGKPLICFNKIVQGRIEKKYIKKVDGFITVCDSFLTYFKKKYNLLNCAVLKNCQDISSKVEKTNKLRLLLNLSSDDKILLYQGVLNPGRGVENTINAASFFDKNIHFVIIGGGPEDSYLRNLVIQKGLKNVHFIGKVAFNDLLNYTASADVGILLIESINISKALTLPNKVFEYMAAGIPFITNKLPEASKIAIEENCGYVIDDSTPEKIAKEINNIFSKLDTSLGINGYAAIESKYNWKHEFMQTKMLISHI